MILLFTFLIFSNFVHAWIGRVLPVSFDEKTKKWNILLGYDKNNKTWTDFGKDGEKSGLKGNVISLQALRDQTNGQYDFVNLKPRMYHLNNTNKNGKENWFHILKVDFIPGSNLYKSAERNFKKNVINDFVWIPLDEAVQNNYINHKKHPDKIDDYLYWFITNYAAKELAQISTNKEEEQESMVQQKSWPKLGSKNTVHFYHSNKPHYEFTNTYAAKIYLNNHEWERSEHYYQAGKFDDPWKAYNEGIDGQTALKDIGFGSLQKELRRDKYLGQKAKEIWENENLQRMINALWAKFTQNEDLKKILLDTKNKIIVEDAGKNDAFFGAGSDYKGTNHLGQMLMQLRDLMLVLKKYDNDSLDKFLPSTWFVYKPYPPEDYIDTYKKGELMIKSPDKIKENTEIITIFAHALKSI